MKNIGKNILALLIGLTISIVALEVAARLLSGVLGVSPYMRYDETLGWTAKPGATKVHKNPYIGFDVTYYINEAGFRGRLYDREKPSGIFRIVVLGDSNGFGWGIPEDEHFSAILDLELDSTQVINLSLSGYGTDQQYLRFLRDGVHLQPDLVILQVSPNDFEEIQHAFFNQKPKPQFKLDKAGGLELHNVPVRANGPLAEAHRANSLPLPFNGWLEWHSYAYSYLNQKYVSARQRYSEGTEAGGLELAEKYTTTSIALFKAIVSDLRQTLDEHDSRGIVFHTWQELSEEDYLDSLSMPVFDLYPILERHRRAGVEVLYRDGVHWTPEGHRIIADELIRRLGAGEHLEDDESSVTGTAN